MAAAVLLALAMAGCKVQMGSVLEARDAGDGTKAVYAATPEQVWKPILAVLNWSSAGRTEARPGEGGLLAWFDGADGTTPTFVGVWVEPLDSDQVQVTVISRKAGVLVARALTEDRFHEDLRQALGIAQAGKPLPLVRP